MSQRSVISECLADHRDQMLRYAGAVSGDVAGAEDLVQEAWLRCDQAARAAPVDKPANLLWRVLRNLCIDRKRRIAHESRIFVGGRDEQQLANFPDDQRSIEVLLALRGELALIERVLESLDARTRAAFEMHRLEGAKLREIAAVLGVSITVAHGLVATATRQIRNAVRQID